MEREFVPLSRLKPREKMKSRENPTEKLTVMMRQISERVNKEALAKYGLRDFLHSDGSLNMAGYANELYSTEDIESDKNRVRDMEIEFSRAKISQVQAFYREKYGAKTQEEIVGHWRKEKIQNKNGQMEMAVTGLLHKILKDDFLVVRASAYDDYKNGVDNIILNKRTGEAICAFDEVHEGGAGERTGEKMEKIKKVASRGGARVRYGIKLEEGKLKRAEMATLPVFYLGLKSAELENLLAKMDFNPDSAVTPAEYDVFAKLTASLKEQKQILDGTDVPPAVRNKLETFESLLEEFEERGVEMREAA
ncbi:MAG: hypothetical protein NTW66_02840 [Candidatus Magasanikbacteria bacterium]|nr:hypothetical protein [Candidatus Magasanikbacteria bacterium]